MGIAATPSRAYTVTPGPALPAYLFDAEPTDTSPATGTPAFTSPADITTAQE